MLLRLEQRYASETGVATLKLRHNNIIGYHLEVPAKQADKLGPEFIHRQTMANAARYTTTELIEMANRIMGAATQALDMEQRLFEALVSEVLGRAAEVAAAARALAALDVAARAGRAGGRARLRPARGRGRPRLRHRRRPPSGGRGGAAPTAARSSPTTATCRAAGSGG